MDSLIIQMIQTILLVLIAPLFTGWIKCIKAMLQNKTPPNILQPYYNLIKLFRKQTILPAEASWIFRFTPYIIFVTLVIISSMVPFITIRPSMASFAIGDVIVIIGLFAISRFFLILSGMDIGTAFGGMGSSREILISSLAEPASLLILFSLALTTQTTNLTLIIQSLLAKPLLFQPSFIFALLSFFMITLAETGRIPLDNPTTHLELTMIHEAIILEYSGRYLALIEWSSQIKLLLYFTLLCNIFFSWGISDQQQIYSLILALFAIVIKLMTSGLLLSLFETCLAKMRLFKAPHFLGFAFVLSFLSILSHVILTMG